MSISPEYYFFAVLFGLNSIALVMVGIYYRFIKILIGFIVTAIGLLLTQKPLFNWFIRFANQFLGINSTFLPYQAPDTWGIALHMGFILLLTILLINVIKFLFINWDGVKSKRQANLEQTNSKISLIKECQFYQKK